MILGAELLESFGRVLASAAAIFLYALSKASGLSMTDIMLRSLALTNPLTAGIFGALFPFLSGILVTFLLLRRLRSGEAIRTIVFVSTLVVLEFSDLYAAAFGRTGGRLAIELIPNLAFMFGMLAYSGLWYEFRDEDVQSLFGHRPLWPK